MPESVLTLFLVFGPLTFIYLIVSKGIEASRAAKLANAVSADQLEELRVGMNRMTKDIEHIKEFMADLIIQQDDLSKH